MKQRLITTVDQQNWAKNDDKCRLMTDISIALFILFFTTYLFAEAKVTALIPHENEMNRKCHICNPDLADVE